MTPEKAAKLGANLLIQAFKKTRPEDEAEDPSQGQAVVRRPAPSNRVFCLDALGLQVIDKAVLKIRAVTETYPPEPMTSRPSVATRDCDR